MLLKETNETGCDISLILGVEETFSEVTTLCDFLI